MANDVPMLESRHRLGLRAKSRNGCVARQHSVQNHLQRHNAIEACVPRLVNDAHAATSDLLQQFVITERTQVFAKLADGNTADSTCGVNMSSATQRGHKPSSAAWSSGVPQSAQVMEVEDTFIGYSAAERKTLQETPENLFCWRNKLREWT
jgi:hypothetical protein